MLSRHLFKFLIALVALSSNHLYAATCNFTLVNEWNSGFTSSVTITNDTDQVINGWDVSMDFSGSASINGMWNASLSGSGPYQAANKNYNSTIQPNSSVQFGFNSNKTTSNTPASAPTFGGICSSDEENTPPPPTPTEPITAQCEYVINSEWSTGFSSAVKITNTAQQAINDWTVGMDFTDGSTITNLWNANLSGNNPYQATNKSYNKTIAANSTIQFGFNSRKAVSGRSAVVPLLSGICSADVVSNEPPVANAEVSPLQGTTPLIANFNASGSSDPDGDTLSYRWDFGDGNFSSEVVTSHTYTEAGSYTIVLTVTDSELNSDTATVTLTATDPPPPPSTASYILDAERSSLHFVSTKKVHVVETHTFTELSGDISAEGDAVVRINLDSVETGIETRNQRMRDFLFETATFSEAEISLGVDLAEITNLAVGESLQKAITPTVDLHGVSIPIDALVNVTRLNADTILVQNTQPILLAAADFSLTDGIETLRSLASLSVISYSVPTNFTLFFNTQ